MDSSHFSQHNYKYIYIFLGLLQRIILGCFRSHFFQHTGVTKPTLTLYYVCIISEALPVHTRTMISPMSLRTVLESTPTFTAGTSHHCITLMWCAVAKRQEGVHANAHSRKWCCWHGSGLPGAISSFLLLNRQNGNQLSKQVFENWLQYIQSWILTCRFTPVRRTRHVPGYALLKLAHESQKERLLHVDN